MSPLLHELAATLDPGHDLEWVAARLGATVGRPISAASAAYLIDHKLRPLGVLSDSPPATQPTSTPDLLGLTLHAGVVPAPAVRACSTLLRPLFFPPVVILALAVLINADAWLWRSHRVGMAGSVASLVTAIGSGNLPEAAVDGLSLLALAIPLVGLTRRVAKAVLTFGAPR